MSLNKTAGYSGTALAKKLGLKQNYIVKIINEPIEYSNLVMDLPPSLQFEDNEGIAKDFIHFFTKDSKELNSKLPQLKKEIKPHGMIWVSWPKKTSKVPTDITEDVIRNFALNLGLVDVKVCAVDDIWSGLKLVIPVKDRPKNI